MERKETSSKKVKGGNSGMMERVDMKSGRRNPFSGVKIL